MKKIEALLMTGIVLMSAFALVMPVTAQDTVVSIEDVNLGVGESKAVPIIIENVTGVVGAKVNISYNSSVVHITSVANSDFCPGGSGGMMFYDFNNTLGYTTIIAQNYTTAGLTGDVKLAEVTLEVEGNPGDWSYLNLTIDELYQFGEVSIDATPDNGTFNIKVDNPPMPNITNPQDGDTLSGPVIIEEIDESGEEDIVYNLFEYYYDKNCNCTADDEGSEWIEIGNDTDGTDGWSVEWDTTALPDCCYMIRATMGDEQGQTGQDKINVVLSNHDPVPVITNPQDGDKLSGVVTIEEVDDSFDNGADIVYNLFEYYYDKNCNCTDDDGNEWYEIGNDTDGSDGWSVDWDTAQHPDCCYMIRATMGDKHGRTGQDEINVKIDNTPPVLTNANATPLIIPDDTDNEPKWGENATLNVTVIDHSSVSVTINLSAIGGSATKPMTNIGGNIWSVTTNASNGTAGWNGTAYEPYYLQVNATDVTGKSNTSVSISLTVMNNGDVSGNGAVTSYDTYHLAMWLLEEPGFEVIEEVADVSGNGEVTSYDTYHLAMWLLDKTGFELK